MRVLNEEELIEDESFKLIDDEIIRYGKHLQDNMNKYNDIIWCLCDTTSNIKLSEEHYYIIQSNTFSGKFNDHMLKSSKDYYIMPNNSFNSGYNTSVNIYMKLQFYNRIRSVLFNKLYIPSKLYFDERYIIIFGENAENFVYGHYGIDPEIVQNFISVLKNEKL